MNKFFSYIRIVTSILFVLGFTTIYAHAQTLTSHFLAAQEQKNNYRVKNLHTTDIDAKQVSLQWKSVEDAGKYQIRVKTGTKLFTTVTTTETKKKITGLEHNSPYTFQVRARVHGSWRRYSKTLTVQTQLSSDPNDYLVDNEVIVKLERDRPLLSNYPKKALKISELLDYDYVKLTINDNRPIATVMDELERLPGVVSVEQNSTIELTGTVPNDPLYNQQWYHTSKGLYTSDAWDEETGSSEIIIAIIDNGVDIDHPDLKDNVWVNEDEIADNGIDDDNNGYIDDINGWDFTHDNNDPRPELNGVDDDGDGYTDEYGNHGTVVAGAAAAVGNNGTYSAGVMWDASIMALQKANADDPTATSTADIVAEAVYYAITNDADIINMSFTAGSVDDDVFREALEAAADQGIILVNSAPNADPPSAINSGYYPLCYDNVLGVTGYEYYSDTDNGLWGAYGDCVDIMGAANVVSTNVYYSSSSQSVAYSYTVSSPATSYATPTVSGVVGLLLSKNSTLTIDEVTTAILSTATYKESTAQYDLKLANAADALDSIVCPYLYYKDDDGDGLGDTNTIYSQCTDTVPSGYVTNDDDTNDDDYDNDGVSTADDCDDTDAGASDYITFYYDSDKDGLGSTTYTTQACENFESSYWVDNDDDLYPSDYDNDGTNTSNDCNDKDSSVTKNITYYADTDGDGLGDVNNKTTTCSNTAPTGYVTNSSDQNDSDYDNDGTSTAYDCDDTNASLTSPTVVYYQDADGDGIGNNSSTSYGCPGDAVPSGYTTVGGDCNDSDGSVSSYQTYYYDADGDGTGDPNVSTQACSSTAPSGYVSNNQDANDNSTAPNCGNGTTATLYSPDVDGDGHGADSGQTYSCSSMTGYVADIDDCNDSDANVYAYQTYYLDYDNDGLGNSSNAIQACSSTAPTGYVSNASDTDDYISTDDVEISEDNTDNDGDGEVDEVNTENENGDNPLYEQKDPDNTADYAASVEEIAGAKNGAITVTYADQSVYQYTIFDVDTDKKTIVQNYNDTGYLIVIHPKGKYVALVNVYTGALYEKEKISDKKWKSKGLKLYDLRDDDSIEAIITTKKDQDIHLTIVQVQLNADNRLRKTDAISVERKNVDPTKTYPKTKKIALRNEDATELLTLHVNADYELSIDE